MLSVSILNLLGLFLLTDIRDGMLIFGKFTEGTAFHFKYLILEVPPEKLSINDKTIT